MTGVQTCALPILVNSGEYVVRHNPMVLFNDVNGNTTYMNAHVRPYSVFASDLQNNTVGRYNFITPNLTNDMHDLAPGSSSSRPQGDHWLSLEIPKIMASQAYSNNGAIFITWDEGNGSTSDGPLGMIVLSPLAKGHGYSNSVHYTHSSMVRTMQDIFGVRPYLADAANALNFSDLFVTTNVTVSGSHLISPKIVNNNFGFTASNVVIGTAYYIQASSNFLDWVTLRTNMPGSTTMTILDTKATNFQWHFYRLQQAP